MTDPLPDRPVFDVVVCGAGSSGSTVAGRLAEDPTLSVLLLEAGPDDNRENVHDPALWPTNFGTEATWNYTAQPSPELDGRAIPYFLGRGLGGGGSVNVTVWSRGHRADWDSYARITDDDVWDYDHVLEVYRRIESYQGDPDPRRGTDGPMWIEHLPVTHPFQDAVTAAAAAAGVRPLDSLNGELMERDAGAATRDATVRDGRRRSPYRSYVHPHLDRPNLTVVTGATVAEVLFAGDRASGVRLVDGRVVHATRQVVLSLGAVNTPAVLLRSGIGDRDQLDGLGIAVRHHAPGVGRDLHDHMMVPVIWEGADDADLPGPTSASAPNGIYWDLDDPTGHAVVCYVDHIVVPSETTAARRPVPARGATFLVGVRARSRGRVGLASRADDAVPVVEHGFYTDPADLPAVQEVLARVTEIGDAAALRPYLGDRVLPPTGASAGAVAEYVREATATFWHQSGTAAMGTGPTAVVDSRLRVNGVTGLRVVDVSVLPHVPIGNTMAPAVVIGEQGARFVRDDLDGR